MILLAKNDRAHQFLQDQFRDRQVDKEYLALVDGRPPTPNGRVEVAIGRDPKYRQRMAPVLERDGKEAISEYFTMGEFPKHTYLRVKIMTGRTHQIRVHLNYLGCPVVGDTVYGRKTPSIPVERQFLHAFRLSIVIPGEVDKRCFEAPLALDLEGILKELTKNYQEHRTMIDLRSDTVTLPSPEMREVIAKAEVGDDVYGEDPTVNQLEVESARLLGKEAALFIPSGTMGNLAAVLTHCERGSEIILGNKAHIFLNEAGGAAALGGIHSHTIPNQKDGTLKVEDIESAIRFDDIHHPRTRLICLENTQNMCGGVPLTVEYTKEVGEIARDHQLKLHLDGARIFNAAAALDVDPAQLVEPVDSVMFCLSKGLGAPVGSILGGDAEFINRARRIRKMLGGGMRQAGLIAAAGLFALKKNVPLLKEDQRRALMLAEGLKDMSGISLMDDIPPSNMVYLNLDPEFSLDAVQMKAKLKEKGILGGIEGDRQIRLVTHLWITDKDIEVVIEGFKEITA